VWKALAQKPRVLVLIDGVFESQPSVWHREILDALEAGVAVFGAASMGALRAAELWRFGMVGIGEIFRAFRDGKLIDDAEVALLHAGAEHGYRPLSVPLVNVRHAARVLAPRDAKAVLRAAEGIFYQERTWPKILASARVSDRARMQLQAPGVEDLKAKDAAQCLSAAAAFLSTGGPTPPWVRRPYPPSHARRRRAALSRGGVDAAAGLRRALLVRFARTLGIDAPGDSRLCAALERCGLDRAQANRLASDVAVERLALQEAARLVNDGPSPDEAAASEAVLRRALRQR
jgi:hypothetical protein